MKLTEYATKFFWYFHLDHKMFEGAVWLLGFGFQRRKFFKFVANLKFNSFFRYVLLFPLLYMQKLQTNEDIMYISANKFWFNKNSHFSCEHGQVFWIF